VSKRKKKYFLKEFVLQLGYEKENIYEIV